MNKFKRGDIIVKISADGYHKIGDIAIIDKVSNYTTGSCLDVCFENDDSTRWAVNAIDFRKINIEPLYKKLED